MQAISSALKVQVALQVRFVIILAMAFSLFGTRQVQARENTLTPVVWYVAPTGTDTNSCAEPALPCLTINAAITKAVSDDIVQVAVGKYTGTGESVVLVNKNISLQGGWDPAFTEQTGLSTIDGENARIGVYINESMTAVIDRFAIRYGSSAGDGGGIHSRGLLTLTRSIVSENVAGRWGGGISNFGLLVVNETTISNNISGAQGRIYGYGGGISSWSGSVTINNSTISGNRLLFSGAYGSALVNYGYSFVLNNTTVSGNTGAEAIYSFHGDVVLNNSTVTNNTGGILKLYGKVILRNSIVAGNTKSGSFDCKGGIASYGYNLIGSISSCGYIVKTGDKVGTSTNPLNPRLLPLRNYGGPTRSHALMADSPALNAGNPAVPGSGGNACLATDQRGNSRPVDGLCDMGAFEGFVMAVDSITRGSNSPSSAQSVKFNLKFTDSVTGVDTITPFSDFALKTTGVPGAAITGVTGSGALYTVTVNTGKGNGTIRLDVLDDDSILDSQGSPLGSPGMGNGNFTTGQVYTIQRIPTTLEPASATWVRTPVFKWTTVPRAVKYHYQLLRGSTLLYSKIVEANVCGATTCTSASNSMLNVGVYDWRVRALVDETWNAFSEYKTFSMLAPRAGLWKGDGLYFYITPNRASVDDFSIYVSVDGCGNYKITRSALVPVVDRGFEFTGSFYASGTFDNLGSAHGTLGLKLYYIPGCGYLTGGPFTWSAVWKSTSQPDMQMDPDGVSRWMRLLDTDDLFGPFRIDPVKP